MKSLFRPRNIVLLIVLVIAAGIGYNLWWALTATPVATVDYAAKINEAATRVQAHLPGDNQWTAFEQVLADAARVRTDAGVDPPADWPKDIIWPPDGAAFLGAPEPPQVVAAATRAVLERLDAAGVPGKLDQLARPGRFIRELPPGASLIDINLPACSDSRQLARLLAARMRTAHAAGNDAEVVRTFEHTLAAGRILALQSTLIERLVGTAIVELALSELRQELTDRPLSQEHLRAALAAIDRQLPLPPLSLAMECERAFAMDAIQRTHTDNGHGDGRFIPSAAVAFATGPTPAASQASVKRLANLTWFLFPTKKQSIDKANAFYDNLNTRSALPRAGRAAAGNADLEVERLKKDRYITLSLVLPALERAMSVADSNALSVAGTRIMLAIELARAQSGSYPASLAELVPGELAELPTDPVSGKPWGYYIPDPAKDPRPYLLYSYGDDGSDDNAAESANPHEALKPGATPGSDFIINARRQ